MGHSYQEVDRHRTAAHEGHDARRAHAEASRLRHSSLRRRAHGREPEKAAAPLKLDPALVGKLLEMLASDNDGDVLAAARALTDELKRCDLSPEALAAGIAKE